MPLSDYLVHYVVEDDRGDPKPLCGDWRGNPSWTTVVECTTCPECLARLRGTKGAPP
jgi:hypothetical protein